MRIRIVLTLILFLTSVRMATAQTTAFTYQGKLTDGANPANGNYDLQFKLFDTVTVGTGTQQGATVTKASVAVTAGIFTVQLDFGAGVFSGPPRFLEIGVRPAGSPNPYAALAPRQSVTSTPFALRSLNSSVADTLSNACVGCVTSTQVGSVAGAAVAGQIPVAGVPAGSASYIQNTGVVQNADFNIDGDGTANLFNARAEFQIGNQHVLSIQGSQNIFAGVGAGTSNTTGQTNAFFGTNAGNANTTGSNNSFFGFSAGFSNKGGGANSFFGYGAGRSNTLGGGNAFFGSGAGLNNTVGVANAFFGRYAGESNTTGNDNSFFGNQAGYLTTTASRNAFFGSLAGGANTNGEDNAFFGYWAGRLNISSGNSIFGSQAGASNSNGSGNSMFGYLAGFSNTSGVANSFFGGEAGYLNANGSHNAFFGAQAGHENTTGNQNSFLGRSAGYSNTTGASNTFIGEDTGDTNTTGSNNTIVGATADVATGNLSFATAIGAGAVVSASNTVVLGRTGDNVIVPGNLFVQVLGTGGSTNICTTAAGKISTCSSSLRYKSAVQSFTGGLDIVNSLRPITFNWRDGGMRDVGFSAEEVEKIEPLLVTHNSSGEIEGVKYGQLTTVLVNAIQQQQAIIDDLHHAIQQQQILLKQQQKTLAALKKVVCQSNSNADGCKP